MTEAQLQRDIVKAARQMGFLVVMINNSQGRSARQGAMLKQLGMQPGAADFVAIHKDGSTIWCEIKTPKGKIRPSQTAFAHEVAKRGHYHFVIRDYDSALRLLQEWRG